LIRLRDENRSITMKAKVAESETSAALESRIASGLEELRKHQEDKEELRALQAEATEHRRVLEQLPQVAADYKRLLRQLEDAKANTSALSDDDFFKAADENLRDHECIQHLKQLCLAARMWSNDHNEVLPVDWLTMRAEVNDPKLLVCPGDISRSAALDWNSLGPQNVSYQILSPGVPETDPDVVYISCLIHRSVGMVDGSAVRFTPEFRVMQEKGAWKITRVATSDD
jgi:hypothetical protein